MPSKRRTLPPVVIDGGTQTTYNSDGSVYSVNKITDLKYDPGSDLMDCTNTPGWPFRMRTNTFFSVKERLVHIPYYLENRYVSTGRISTTGPVLVAPLRTVHSRDLSLESNTGLGATAWKRFNPGKPEINSLQSLVELKDLPSMARQLADIRKNLKSFASLKRGSEAYLASEFAWRPLLNDAWTIGTLHRTLHTRLQQLKKDNGKTVRRTGIIRQSSVSATYEATEGNVSPGLHRWLRLNRTCNTHKSDKVWAVIAFRYFSPDVGSSQWERRMLIQLLGLQPNLSLAYELTPWSWAVDWFTNFGDVLQNMSQNAAESLVADYSALMHTTTYHVNTQGGGMYHCGYPSKVPHRYASGSHTQERVVKSRTPVMPYELAGDPLITLSTRQLAIAAALGLSRG